ncbi:MAG TPA: sulfite exporter TauE/SafE family protein [Jatrophihabitans sp.]|uniref:sulfite exporter TauE/SafE family protein n=1 Tax=Jatrophihabitans sp. TaxID=1932789 RepID=UPI002DF78581|nr:sulfite exporter TauE/SafE family protein [Jatrophihabitans sp.]
MGAWDVLLLLVAGVAGGLTGSIAGLASLTTYPALLAVGLPPVTANVTNTVALVANSIGSVSGSRPELVGQRARIVRLGAAGLAGGIAGGVLLLLTPAGSFERIVPFLIALGSATILVERRPDVAVDRPHVDPHLLPLGVFVIGVYGGYFGAAAGVLMLALLLAALPETLPRCNGLKNVLMGGANAVAAILFVVVGRIDWTAALPLAAGLFLGGRVGPVVVRHSPARVLRVLIALGGLGLAVYLGVKAYG